MYSMSNLGTVMSMRRGKKCRTLLFDAHFLQKQTSGTSSCCFSVFRVTIDCLLRGNNDLSYQINVHIFEAVQTYIKLLNILRQVHWHCGVTYNLLWFIIMIFCTGFESSIFWLVLERYISIY